MVFIGELGVVILIMNVLMRKTSLYIWQTDDIQPVAYYSRVEHHKRNVNSVLKAVQLFFLSLKAILRSKGN